MADVARKLTDKRLSELEKRIEEHYRTSEKEIIAKWNEYMERGEKRLDGLYNALEKAKGTDKYDEAFKRYQKALESYTIQNERYANMVDNVTTEIAYANETALAYAKGEMPWVYRVNFNQVKVEAVKYGIAFDIINQDMLKNLIESGDIILPNKEKRLKIPKDKRWNTKKLNAQVTQGIIQGESIKKISKRILPVVNNNKDAAIRNARTIITGAENAGRNDSYKRLEENGAIVNKVWIATPDGHTRAWHLTMDGQEVPRSDTFTDGKGNELSYPGDPDGAAETVYNCRCSMRTHIVGIRKTDGTVKDMDVGKGSEFHRKQIAQEKQRRQKENK